MRCSKCGYYSFDYLSQCKKCGIDLSKIRQDLGFMDVEPKLPFSLDALLAGGGTDGEINFGGSLGAAADTMQGTLILGPSDEVGALDLNDTELHLPDLAEEDIGLISLELEDDNITIELPDDGSVGKAAAKKGLEETLAFDASPDISLQPTVGLNPSLEKAAKIAGDLEGDLTLDLSEEDMDNILGNLQALTDEQKEPVEKNASHLEEEITIDLSDVDLQGFTFDELETEKQEHLELKAVGSATGEPLSDAGQTPLNAKPKKKSGGAPQAPKDPKAELVLDPLNDMDGIEFDFEEELPQQEKQSFTIPKAQSVKVEKAKSPKGPTLLDDGEGGLVLDLSDEDLDGLVLELPEDLQDK